MTSLVARFTLFAPLDGKQARNFNRNQVVHTNLFYFQSKGCAINILANDLLGIALRKNYAINKTFLTSIFNAFATIIRKYCWAPLNEECPQHHGQKGDPGVTTWTCGAKGERAHSVENASHPRRPRLTRVRPWALDTSWCPNSITGVS